MASLDFIEINCGQFIDGNKYDLCMSLDFEDRTDDILLLTKEYGEDTVFVGKLLNEETSAAVIYDTSNPDEIEVSKLSNFLKNYTQRHFFLSVPSMFFLRVLFLIFEYIDCAT